jgi:hypothetical protein
MRLHLEKAHHCSYFFFERDRDLLLLDRERLLCRLERG